MVVNVTVLNGMGVTGEIADEPVWTPATKHDGKMLEVSITRSEIVWPWVGWIALRVTASSAAKGWSGVATGFVFLARD